MWKSQSSRDEKKWSAYKMNYRVFVSKILLLSEALISVAAGECLTHRRDVFTLYTVNGEVLCWVSPLA